jgi:baculoviral IAP repeat-containing protein 6
VLGVLLQALECSNDNHVWTADVDAASASTLSQLLTLCVKAYEGSSDQDSDAAAGSSDEDDDMYGDGNDSDADDAAGMYGGEKMTDDERATRADRTAEMELFRRLRETEAAGKAAAEAALPASAKRVRSMFSSKEGGQILIQEFRGMREEGPTHGIQAEAVDHDVYRWTVQLRDFAPKSALARGLRRLVEEHGYDYVELSFSFARGIHPFYPPTVQIIRPRLAGGAMWRVMNAASLQLANWRPVRTRGMLDVVLALKSNLEEWAEVDIASPANTLDLESGAYSELERMLVAVMRATECKPRASAVLSAEDAAIKAAHTAGAQAAAKAKSDAAAEAAAAEADAGSGAASKAGGGAKLWAKGTGYSTGGRDHGWNPETYLAAQAEQDRQLMLTLRTLLAYLTRETPGRATQAQLAKAATAGAAASSAASSASGSGAGRAGTGLSAVLEGTKAKRDAFRSKAAAEASRFRVLSMRAVDKEDVATFEDLATDAEEYAAAALAIKDTADERDRVISSGLSTVAASCLLPLLAQQLGGVSLMDLSRRILTIRILLSTVRALASWPSLLAVLTLPAASDQPGKGGASVAEMLQAKRRQAAMAVGTADDGAEYDLFQDVVETATLVENMLAEHEASVAEARATVTREVARQQAAAAETAADAGTAPPSSASSSSSASSASGSASASASSADTAAAKEEEYVSVMRPLQYGYMPGTAIPNFHYQSKAAVVTKSGRLRLRRIGLEHSTLSDSLPISRSSTVFVRFPEARSDTIRCVIVGPEDTPYSGGVFVFDIFFPAEFPASPPLVNLMTTGGGSVRFNPNLYNCGKVCLSVLGTWPGAPGEGWNRKVSTLHQVLVSIQSLIMVPDPYFNEPGYQRSMHTPEGQKASAKYSGERRVATVKWAMVDILAKPPVGFEEVVRNHFRLRGQDLLQQIDKWVEDNPPIKGPLSAERRKFAAALTKLGTGS